MLHKILCCMGLFGCALMSQSADYRSQYPLPSLTVPEGWGVNIHFTDPKPGEMELLAGAGFKWVRMDFFWHQIETKKGVYDFSAYDRLLSSLKKHGIRPIFILDYGNDLYQQGSPREPQSVKAFCNFVEQTMKHYRHQGVLWEMWNEPNIFFWQPKPDVQQYITLATEVGKTIRKVAPDEWYVGAGTSGIDDAFLSECFKAGLLKYWDAVTVHPYRTNNPETVVPDWGRLRLLIDRYAEGKKVPMISGEWGYSEKYSGLDLEKQSQYIVRQYLINLSQGVGLSIWYDWKNDGLDPKEPEHHFGSVYSDLKPKPTYLNAQAIATALKGKSFVMRLRQPDPNDWVLVYADSKGSKCAVGWSTSTDSTSTLKLTPSPRVLPKTALPQGLLDRASTWVNLPESAAIGNAEQLAEVLWPSFSNLKDGEALALYDYPSLETMPLKPTLTLRPTDAGNLAKKLEKLPRISDRLTEFRTLAVKLISPGIPPLAQACRVANSAPVKVNVMVYDGGRVAVDVLSVGAPLECRVELDSDKVPVKKSGFSQMNLKAGSRCRPIQYDLSPEEMSGALMVQLIDDKGKVLGSVGPMHFLPIRVDQGKWNYGLEGDDKIKASASGEVVTQADNVWKSQLLRVNYEFEQGWKYMAIRNTAQQKTDLPGKPKSVSMWVKGDGSGCALKVRILDASGQTHQVDGMNMDWTDNRFITIPLNRSNVSWGGKNDGIIHYPIRFDSVLLVDGLGKAHKGVLDISNIVVAFD